jgi:hypothetical protein
MDNENSYSKEHEITVHKVSWAQCLLSLISTGLTSFTKKLSGLLEFIDTTMGLSINYLSSTLMGKEETIG